jgi:outer membrane protein OmpA-like peptidoglycan-associated protein
VTFALGSASPHFDEVASRTLIGWLNSHPGTYLVVDGHSDSLGSPAFNLSLSQQRAGQMVRHFVAAGLPRERITRRAFGNYIPVVGAREDSAENRRVVLSVAGMKDCPESESP